MWQRKLLFDRVHIVQVSKNAKGATYETVCNKLDKEADFYNRVAHEAWQFEANEMGDTDIYNLLTEEN